MGPTRTFVFSPDLNKEKGLINIFSPSSVPSQASLRRLGAQMCGLFAEVEEEKFARRMDELLPLLDKEINPDNYEDVSGHISQH